MTVGRHPDSACGTPSSVARNLARSACSAGWVEYVAASAPASVRGKACAMAWGDKLCVVIVAAKVAAAGLLAAGLFAAGLFAACLTAVLSDLAMAGLSAAVDWSGNEVATDCAQAGQDSAVPAASKAARPMIRRRSASIGHVRPLKRAPEDTTPPFRLTPLSYTNCHTSR